MRILAIETATPASSVALGVDDELLAMSFQVDRRGHVGFLVPAMEFCFKQAGWKPADIDAVVVDVGPGLFTGIRAGLATAQGMAAATGAQLVGLTSLDALAFRAATGHRMIWPVVD
ncbi:MAG: tRNA (adenosine(37)-N6)-threonylcarbamoyltransferase complex dimerization subunit type 1 TsaB, partial [Acidimicrobiia bacterium]